MADQTPLDRFALAYGKIADGLQQIPRYTEVTDADLNPAGLEKSSSGVWVRYEDVKRLIVESGR